jgi:hypothetical protein
MPAGRVLAAAVAWTKVRVASWPPLQMLGDVEVAAAVDKQRFPCHER